MVVIKDVEMPNNCYDCYRNMYCIAGIDGGWRPDKRIEGCPLVEIEERKVGKWIEIWDLDHLVVLAYQCSECGIMINTKSNYCPNCGAEMRGDKNE